MDIHSAQYYIAVYTCGSLSKAAREHYVTQPVIARTISSLEDEFSCTFFDRSKHGVVPTKAGDAFYQYALEFCTLYQKIAGGMSEYSGRDNLSLSIAGITPPVREFLPAAVSLFNKRFPEITVSIERHVASEMIPIMEEGKHDFYITIMSDILKYSNLKSQLLLSENLQLVTKKEKCPKNDRDAISLLKKNPIFILSEQDAPVVYQLITDYLDSVGVKSPDLRPSRPFETLFYNAAADLGVALSPAVHAFNYPDLGVYNIKGSPTLQLGIAWRKETLPGRTFLNIMRGLLS